ncbi:MAG: hypothetical protein NZ930_06715 [Candidatus Bipolaricaulota bacterium]|nr:hypothetical protein [Candidatus Bipolaricaulota bacterium]MDW8031755.1 hypothetical protein [Candidatus Bipolaricaulota bacterium]
MGKQRWLGLASLLIILGLLAGHHLGNSQQASAQLDPVKAEQIFQELKELLLTSSDVNEVMIGPQWLLSPPWFQPWTWSLQATGRLEAQREERLGNPISAAAVFQKRGRTREEAIRLTVVLLYYMSGETVEQLFAAGPLEVIGFGTPTDLSEGMGASIQEALKGWVDDVQVYKYEPDEFALAFRKQVVRRIEIEAPLRSGTLSLLQQGIVVGAFRSPLLSPEERAKPEAEQWQLVSTRLIALTRRQVERLEKGPVGSRR